MNDGVLAEALRARDPGALAALYDTYAENIYRYCRVMLPGPDAAQVALRDTLIAAEALVGSLADRDGFRTWLYALARGECLRRRTAPVSVSGDAPAAGGARPPDDGGPARADTPPAGFPILSADPSGPGGGFGGAPDSGAEADLRSVARSAVASLSVDDRELLELSARHDMSPAELAAVVGAGQRHTDALLQAATDRLREAITVELVARGSARECEWVGATVGESPDGLTRAQRERLRKHLIRCETCSRHRMRQVSPAKVFSLLPQVALPETLRVRVLSAFIDPELVPYRRFVAKRVGSLDAAGYPRARCIRQEGRLAQAIAGTVAAVATVAAIALVFAQFADGRDDIAAISPRWVPSSGAGVTPGVTPAPGNAESAGDAGNAENSDGKGSGAGATGSSPVSRDVAEPVIPVVPAGPVPLPRPAPPPTPSRAPVTHPPSSASPRPTAGTSGPTPMPPSPGDDDEPTSVPTVTISPPGDGHAGGPPPAHWPGRPPRPGPPPAHWSWHPRPGGSPGRDHQHHPQPGHDCPSPVPSPAPNASAPPRSPSAPGRGGPAGNRPARRGETPRDHDRARTDDHASGRSADAALRRHGYPRHPTTPGPVNGGTAGRATGQRSTGQPPTGKPSTGRRDTADRAATGDRAADRGAGEHGATERGAGEPRGPAHDGWPGDSPSARDPRDDAGDRRAGGSPENGRSTTYN
ncbi:hypothetical protein JOL79_10825 [Microbispora sp. RL4-1S]|uniref:Sigma-70 family RNA polymerase sigma factor n=1 Tax=Microbispora oryzae TaxID=2806554 RepID=A0A941AHP0_9ACTN|nr:sigma-70 family RNA polymerase sigma factor [Microbispora oryzae]MBP2704305.1 hypothetical protein [Microbispora oryzae]